MQLGLAAPHVQGTCWLGRCRSRRRSMTFTLQQCEPRSSSWCRNGLTSRWFIYHASYLGMIMGPTAGSKDGQAQSAKYWNRSRALACCGAPPNETVKQYNIRALTVYGYRHQFVPHSKAELALEKRALTGVMRMPFNSVGVGGLVQWDCWGGPHIRSLAAVARATLVRFALSTTELWMRY